MSTENKQPSRRQIVFNWLMADPEWATKKDGHWGGADEVASIDALLAALDAVYSGRENNINECEEYLHGTCQGSICGLRRKGKE